MILALLFLVTLATCQTADLQTPYPELELFPAAQLGICNCRGGTNRCQCCLRVNFRIPMTSHVIDQQGCLFITYDGPTLTATIGFSLGGNFEVQRTYSASNPPDVLCFGIRWGASICLNFNSLGFTRRSFTGCAAVNARAAGMNVFSVNVGCWDIELPFVREDIVLANSQRVDLAFDQFLLSKSMIA